MAMPRRGVLAAFACGCLATCGVGFVGDAFAVDQAVTIIASVVAGVVVMLLAAFVIDEFTSRR
jgi:uncharacterized membrane protein YcjF (UPF0283 family)